MTTPYLAIKVDVDTNRGTRDGTLALATILARHSVPATFLFSLGPDNTGKAIRRIFRPGFLKKVLRTKVSSNYGWRTLLSGTLLPAPNIGERNADTMRKVKEMGFEVGIHAYDHFRWQDYIHTMSEEEVAQEFNKAQDAFARIFGEVAHTCGAPGWQTNAKAFEVYDQNDLLYVSDCRGISPFFPRSDRQTFRTLQIPTTMPTLDELLGRSGFSEKNINQYYIDNLHSEFRNVHTIHAELEGMQKAKLFEDFLVKATQAGVKFFGLEDWARQLRSRPETIPFCKVVEGSIPGRSGTVASQGPFV